MTDVSDDIGLSCAAAPTGAGGFCDIENQMEIMDDVYVHAYGSIFDEIFNGGPKETAVAQCLAKIKHMCKGDAPYSRDNLLPLRTFIFKTSPGGKWHGATNVENTVQRIAIFLIWYGMDRALELLIKEGPFKIRAEIATTKNPATGEYLGTEIGMVDCEPTSALWDLLRYNEHIFNPNILNTIRLVSEIAGPNEEENCWFPKDIHPLSTLALLHYKQARFTNNVAVLALRKLDLIKEDDILTTEQLKDIIHTHITKPLAPVGAPTESGSAASPTGDRGSPKKKFKFEE